MSRYGNKALAAATNELVNDASDDGIFYSANLSNSGSNDAWVIFLNSSTEAVAANLKGLIVPAGETVPVVSAVPLGPYIRAFSTLGSNLSFHLFGNNHP